MGDMVIRVHLVGGTYVNEQTIGDWLEDLASSSSTPGGGAAAAMNTAIGASLISMVCNLTIGKPKYVEHELTMVDVRSRAEELRTLALELAEADAAAFDAVMAAYKLPKSSDAEKAARTEAIQEALVGAADVPLRIAGAAADVIALAGRIMDGANVNVISDVAVAADSARAGLQSAITNVEINRAAIKDETQKAELAAKVARVKDAVFNAGAISESIAARITG